MDHLFNYGLVQYTGRLLFYFQKTPEDVVPEAADGVAPQQACDQQTNQDVPVRMSLPGRVCVGDLALFLGAITVLVKEIFLSSAETLQLLVLPVNLENGVAMSLREGCEIRCTSSDVTRISMPFGTSLGKLSKLISAEWIAKLKVVIPTTDFIKYHRKCVLSDILSAKIKTFLKSATITSSPEKVALDLYDHLLFGNVQTQIFTRSEYALFDYLLEREWDVRVENHADPTSHYWYINSVKVTQKGFTHLTFQFTKKRSSSVFTSSYRNVNED